MTRALEHHAERIANERSAPKLQPTVRWAFVADAIDSRDEDAICYRVAPLHCFPRLMLTDTEFGFFARMPADGSRIEDEFRAPQGREPGRFGIPLVPTNQRADFAESRRENFEPKIAGREIIFF